MVVGAAGFEPTTSCSQSADKGIAGVHNGSQPVGIVQDGGSIVVQPSQAFTGISKNFTSPVLPLSLGARRADLQVTDGGDEWLTVREVADTLKVCTATVYKIIDRGELPHMRVLNSVRVKRRDLVAYCEGCDAV